MSTFWQLLDDYLCTKALALPGIAFAATGDVLDVDTAPMPAVLVRGQKATLSPGAHGDGQVHREAAYPYHLAAFGLASDYAAAKRAAQAQLPGLEEIMYDPGLYALIGDDGERMERMEPGEAYLEVRVQRAGVNQKHLGAAVVAFTVHAAR